NNRRHVAALNREKNDLRKNFEEVKTQLDNLLASKNLRKRGGSQDIGTDGETGDLLNSDTSAISPNALPGSNLSKDDMLKALDTSKEFRDVEVQTEEFSSQKENVNNSDLLSRSVGVQTEGFSSQKENAHHNHTTSSGSVSTNSSRTSTDQISRQVGSSNIDS